MPLRKAGPVGQAAGTPTGNFRLAGSSTAPADEPVDNSGPGLGTAVLGAAGLVGAGLLAHKLPPGGLRTGLEYANALRQQLMLSGFAPVKSLLGNVGAAAVASAERRSFDPLKELLSMQTLRDVGTAYKAGRNVAPTASGVSLPGVLGAPGRFMGAADDATRNALQRAGLTAEEAEKAVLQAPLDPKLASALDSPLGRFTVPFRRTPFNQFIEGYEVSKGAHPFVLAGTAGAGAVHGAMTADERYPVTVPFGMAAAARYGVPYGFGALAGRLVAGAGDAGSIGSGLTPVSEYGLTQSAEQPLRPFTEPAALTALRKLTGR